MYKLLRNLHLLAGLFAALFLGAYALGAAQMAYPLYRPAPAVTATDLTLPENINPTPRAVARWLWDTRGLAGELRDVEHDGTGFSLTIAKIGTLHEVRFDPARRMAHIETRAHNPIGMLNRIHHIGGVSHGYWAINAWGWLLASASVLLLVLASSGVVMWFTRHRERRAGAVVLAAGLLWGLTLLVLMRTA